MQTFDLQPKQEEAVEIMKGHMHTLLDGGSRSGKTAIFIYALVVRAFKCKSRHIIFRQIFKDVKASIGLETMPKILELLLPDYVITPNKTDWYWTFPNGSEIWLGGLDDKERTEKILGKEYSTIMFNEISQMGWESVEMALSRLAENSGLTLRAFYDCNPPRKKHWAYKVWFEHLNPVSNLPLKKELYGRLQMNPTHNESNLPEGYIDNVLGNMSDRKRRRFLSGEWLDDVDGALWDSNMIDAYRCKADDVPDLSRIVVGVDPAVTSGENADETGIIVVGKDLNDHVYVLGDYTLKDTPKKWAEAVCSAYKNHEADRVIGEANNGGDLVEINIRTVDPDISYKKVNASRGKIMRAEPIASFYEQGRVHHVGSFPEAEDEMCSYTGEKGEASPNRLDALVWAITGLGLTRGRASLYIPGEIEERPKSRQENEDRLMVDESAWSDL